MPELTALIQISQKEIEQQFAALVNQYPLYAVQNCGWLSPDIILDQNVRNYWRRLLDNVGPSMDESQAEVKAAESAVLAGVHLSLWDWSQHLFFGATPQAFAQEIARRAYITNVGGYLGRLVKAVQVSDDVEARRVIDQMAAEAVNGHKPLRTAAEIADQFERVAGAGKRTIHTATKLDQAVGGLERQTEIIIAARPSMGKTALAWQIARNVAASGKTVAFFSLEMSAVSLWARAACPTAGIAWRDVLAGNVSAEGMANLFRISRELAEGFGDNLRIDDSRQSTETIWQAVASTRADLVVVDHLRLLTDKYTDSEVKRLGWCSQQLREIAKAFDCAMLVVAQLNRQVERQGDKRPSLVDLRESGEIEENADLVLMLFSESYYNPPNPPTHIHPTEIWVRKNRDGVRNSKILLDFDARMEWFSDPSQPVQLSGWQSRKDM